MFDTTNLVCYTIFHSNDYLSRFVAIVFSREKVKMNTEIQNLKNQIELLKKEISKKEKEIQSFDVSEYVSEESYDDYLDECYGEIDICGITCMASNALKSVDPIAYRCGFYDYADSIDPESIDEYNELIGEKEDMEEELENLEEELENLEDEE